jgi:hypothetical protein
VRGCPSMAGTDMTNQASNQALQSHHLSLELATMPPPLDRPLKEPSSQNCQGTKIGLCPGSRRVAIEHTTGLPSEETVVHAVERGAILP